MGDNSNHLLLDKAIGAFLGAACGDALGWPNERAGRSLSKAKTRTPLIQFQQWQRRSGGRFYPYVEIINAGDYSDDTQLMLSLSRSRLQGEGWWQHWTQVELPFWTLYERGGGGATKRAAEAWLDGRSPWSYQRDPQDARRYFEAGGNGVAMRILPHVVYGRNCDSFSAIASNIFIDGIATHGHPRALLGALAYGYALWKSMRRQTPLSYGALVDELISELYVWSDRPLLKDEFVSWLSSAKTNVQNYDFVWQETVIELKDALLLCQHELAKGALVFEDEVLKQLKCFDGKINGSGTVAAVVAVFLASRYAPDPLSGVFKAAFAAGADTDTIASMTGGLLGLICGSDWLGSLSTQVQDSKYLSRIATQLLAPTETVGSNVVRDIVKGPQLRLWFDRVMSEQDGGLIALPNGGTATMSLIDQQIGRSGKYQVVIKKAMGQEGQSIYLTKISKGAYSSPAERETLPVKVPPVTQDHKAISFRTRVYVDSFENSTWFYRDALGFTVKRQEKDVVAFENGLVLTPKSYAARLPNGVHPCSVLVVEVPDIEILLARLKAVGIRIAKELSPWGKERIPSFTCLDPDGNVVEVFSKTQKG